MRIAAQNLSLQEGLEKLHSRRDFDLREEKSKPKGDGDTREDSPELMTEDMKSARTKVLKDILLRLVRTCHFLHYGHWCLRPQQGRRPQ